MVFRGFSSVAETVKKFLELHGWKVHWGAWLDILKDGRLYFDFQIGHWMYMRPPRRGAPCALYVFSEGEIPYKAREWLKGYDYLFAPSKWVASMLERLDLEYIYMPVGIDTDFFRPVPAEKFIDVLSIGIWLDQRDDRKFMHKLQEVAFPYTCYAHTKPTLPRSKLPWLYSSARVYVSLSGCEGFNIPVVEANACGLPVVYNDAPATNEHVYGIGVKPVAVVRKYADGIPFDIHVPDIAKIREEIHNLLRNPARLKTMSEEARRFALNYDYRKAYKPLLEILERR